MPCVRLKSISLIRSLRSGRVSDTLCLSGILAVGKQEQPRRIDPGKVALIALGDHGRDTLRTRRLGQHAEVRQPVHRRVHPATMRRAVADQLPQDRALRQVAAHDRHRAADRQRLKAALWRGVMPKRRERPPGLQKAIEVAGSVQALARLLSLSPARVSRWGTIPAEYVAEIEAKTGVPREQLRPDAALRFRT